MNADPKITVMTSREFNQNTAKAKRAARKGPVYITERGRPAYVLISKEEHEKLKAGDEAGAYPGKRKFISAAEALAHPESAHIDFEVPESKGSWGHKIPDFEG